MGLKNVKNKLNLTNGLLKKGELLWLNMNTKMIGTCIPIHLI